MHRHGKRLGLRLVVGALTIPIIAGVCIGGLFYAERSFKHQQQTSWIRVPATVEDTRLRPLAKFALEYGSRDLYDIDVFTTYSFNQTSQKDWIPLSEKPRPLEQAKSEAAALEGKRIVIRWNPATPSQKFAELQ